MNANHPIVAVVVTYNRCQLLSRCLAALEAQSLSPSRILLIDNASDDGTHEMVASRTPPPIAFEYVRLDENGGGAGGFAEGLRRGASPGPCWLWIMDDDAEPHADALEQLMRVATNPTDVYGSLAVNGGDTAWTTTLLTAAGAREVDIAADVPRCARVLSLPFLGFLAHSTLVDRIGLPDVGYFIAGDDIEYCLRARAAGAKIFVAGESRIEHPRATREKIRWLGRDIAYLSLPPWKRYYDTRNRILTARRHHGRVAWLAVLSSTVVRFIIAMSRDKGRRAQARAFLGGTLDGIRERKGARHASWGIGR